MSIAVDTSVADQKAQQASKRGKHKRVHSFWGKDADVSRELGVQCRSICGRFWGWPFRGPWDIAPGWRKAQGEPCKSCERIASAWRQRNA